MKQGKYGHIAMQKMTLLEREQALIAACDAVNADAAVNATVEEWQAINDPIAGPWADGRAE